MVRLVVQNISDFSWLPFSSPAWCALDKIKFIHIISPNEGNLFCLRFLCSTISYFFFFFTSPWSAAHSISWNDLQAH